MRSVSILMALAMALAGSARAGEPDRARLRAKAALALAFAPPTYAEQYAKAVKERQPLVVFVGQPARHIGNCVCVACESFPDAKSACVVIGLPDGAGLRRVDLAGEPATETIRNAIQESKPERGATRLPARE